MAKFKTELNATRNADQMRNVEVEIDFTSNALASILYRQGETVVLACCTKEARLPGWFPRDSSKGWVHAEYSLLPGSTDSRFRRERRGAKGRTQEIERLVARSLRAAVNLEELGPIALNVDCDILNADGGTRCASITAANLALRLGVRRLISSGICLPKDMRPTEDQRRSGWSAPVLSQEEQLAKFRELEKNQPMKEKSSMRSLTWQILVFHRCLKCRKPSCTVKNNQRSLEIMSHVAWVQGLVA